MSTKISILIVDDDPRLRKTLSDILKAKRYVTTVVATGEEALEKAKQAPPTVALIDLKLDGMSGLELLKRIKAEHPETECIVITGYASQGSAIESINLGAYSYVQKPYDMEHLLVTIRRAAEKRETERTLRESEERYRELVNTSVDGVISVDSQMRITLWNQGAERIFGYTEEEMLGQSFSKITPEKYRKVQENGFAGFGRSGLGPVIGKTLELKGLRKDGTEVAVELSVSSREVGRTYIATAIARDITERKQAEEALKFRFVNLAETVSRIFSLRNPYVATHQQGTAKLTRAVGEKMRLDEDRLQDLYIGSLLHDIGKTAIPEGILRKPGELTEAEWGVVRTHPQHGYDVLRDADLPPLVAELALQHHERLDGSGYPGGLKGDKLSLEVRILMVCNIVDAMSLRHPYRPARSKQEITEEIKKGKGTKYDPDVVDALVKMIESGELELESNG